MHVLKNCPFYKSNFEAIKEVYQFLQIHFLIRYYLFQLVNCLIFYFPQNAPRVVYAFWHKFS